MYNTNNIRGLNKNIIKTVADDTTYLKVTNKLKLDGGVVLNINDTIYRKDENGYEAVTPLNVPSEHLNKISYRKSYKPVTEVEVRDFLNSIDKGIINIKNNNPSIFSEESIEVGNFIDVYYVASKFKGTNVYYIYGVKVNSLGEIKETYYIAPTELFLIVTDIINHNPNIKNRTYLITQEVFYHIHKEDDKVISIIGSIDRNTSISTGEVGQKQKQKVSFKAHHISILGIIDGEYVFLNKEESETLLNVKDDDIRNILKEIGDNFTKH